MLALLSEKIEDFRLQYYTQLRNVIYILITLFFISLFDSVMTFLTPVVMTDSGLTEFQMSLVYASSSVFGLVFDFILARYLHTTHYKRLLTYTLLITLLFPVTMLLKQTLFFFLIGMLVWGLYCNLWGFARDDFVARESKMAFHAASMSLLFIFSDVGSIVGTLIAEPISLLSSNNQQLLTLLAIPFLGLITLNLSSVKIRKESMTKPESEKVIHQEKPNQRELWYLLKVTQKLWPLMLLGILAITVEAIIWTVTPIIGNISSELEGLGGVILATSLTASLISFPISITLSQKFGKKRTATYALVAGSLMLIVQGFVSDPTTYLLITFINSAMFSVLYPAIGAAYADYLRESKSLDNKILSVKDMGTNFAYITGPLIAGILLTTIDSTKLFSVLGAFTLIIGLFVLAVMPKKIDFHDKRVLAD
ncbi:MFS transporter [bacterium]|nr:MFS transporter [bacterium]